MRKCNGFVDGPHGGMAEQPELTPRDPAAAYSGLRRLVVHPRNDGSERSAMAADRCNSLIQNVSIAGYGAIASRVRSCY